MLLNPATAAKSSSLSLVEGLHEERQFCLSSFSYQRGSVRIEWPGGDSVRKAKYVGALLVVVGILFRPESAVEGAQRAMRLWVSSVAPALFPFLVLMPVLTGPEACAAYTALFSRIMQPLFRLPGQAAPAVFIGMISGSPGGAIATARIAGQSGMQCGQVWRIALAVAGVSPAFLVMGVGQGLYGSAALGAKLALIQMAVQLILLFALRSCFCGETECATLKLEQTQDQPVRQAVEHVLVICGYMVFFSALACVAASMLGKESGLALLLLMDLPSGLAELSACSFSGASFVLGAAIGFGGLCIGMQNLDVLGPTGLSLRDYIAVRCMGAALMGVGCMLVLPESTIRLAERVQNPINACAFSVLIAAVLALPGMVYFSKKYLINRARMTAKTR